MPTTVPRKLRLGGVELTLTLDRELAERVKDSWLARHLLGHQLAHPLRHGEPLLNGTRCDEIEWYQTIDLPGGVTTPGFVDHRQNLADYCLPKSLEGKRCLDVATYDGFWAFEMERRGAAEVVAIDIHTRADCDHPTNYSDEYLAAAPLRTLGLGFAYAKRALGSKVLRKVLSVYELSPEVVGTFDFVFVSDLLLHLRDPLRALEAVWTVTRGDLLLAEAYDAYLESIGVEKGVIFPGTHDRYSGYVWWVPSVSALWVMTNVARFQDVTEVRRFEMVSKGGTSIPKVVLTARGGRS